MMPARRVRDEKDFRFLELLTMVAILLGSALLGLEASLAGAAPLTIEPVANRLSALLFNVLSAGAIVALFAYFVSQRAESWRDWGFSSSQFDDYMFGLGMGILIWAAWHFIGTPRPWEHVQPYGRVEFPESIVSFNYAVSGFASIIWVVALEFAAIFVLRELRDFAKSALVAAGFVIAIHVAAAAPETLRQAGGALIGGAVIPLYYLRFGRMMPALVASAVATALWLTIH